MEDVFQAAAGYVALTLEGISIVIVAIGALDALRRSLSPGPGGETTHGRLRNAWLSLARWLLVGLEFLLAADIVRTAISPDWEAIGQLGAIALIRTFLNYFLERDLEAATRLPEAA